jgi:hypothetical protein
MLGGPRERSGFPPPSSGVTPPRCGLFLLRRSQPDEAAAELARRVRQASEVANQPSDPNRGAPPLGGDRVFGNAFWIEPGQSVTKVDGQWRTSILIDPPNGRYPPRMAGTPATPE